MDTLINYFGDRINTSEFILKSFRASNVPVTDELYQKYLSRKEFFMNVVNKLKNTEADDRYDRMQEYHDDMYEEPENDSEDNIDL